MTFPTLDDISLFQPAQCMINCLKWVTRFTFCNICSLMDWKILHSTITVKLRDQTFFNEMLKDKDKAAA